MRKIAVKERIQDLRSNAYVKEKVFGDISSFNFSRKAFYKNVWTEQTIKTRGLFIDTGIKKIVARSFDKFFEIDDKRFYTEERIKEEIVFPVEAYRKENGFLAMLGYDNQSKNLLFCTKSNIGGDFARNFERIFRKIVPEKKFGEIAEYLRSVNATLVFEVVDPINNAHIIRYKEETVFLLDVVFNNFEFGCVSYKELQSIADKFGLPCKKLCYTITNFGELQDLYEQAQNYDYTYENEPIEGFVLRDAALHMYKIKTNYYKFWKYMRNIKQYIEGHDTVNLEHYKLSDKRAGVVAQYMLQHKDDIAKKNIIDVRTEIEGIMDECK